MENIDPQLYAALYDAVIVMESAAWVATAPHKSILNRVPMALNAVASFVNVKAGELEATPVH
jgi:hypothetical protein